MGYVRFRDGGDRIRNGEWNGDDRSAIVATPTSDGKGSFTEETFSSDEVEFLPPCEPSKIVCVGRNYAEHAAELGNDVPDRPLLFLKGPNTLAAHGERISLLPGKERIEYEAELGVVIGERCRNVAAEDAMNVIAGYTCVNDVSNRDDQRTEKNWVRGKAFDDAAPIGPAIATPNNVSDDPIVRCRVNGELRQDSSDAELIFPIPELIEEITAYMTLEPGDVISTGTPEGVGPISDGDTVEVEIEGVGTLRNEFYTRT